MGEKMNSFEYKKLEIEGERLLEEKNRIAVMIMEFLIVLVDEYKKTKRDYDIVISKLACSEY